MAMVDNEAKYYACIGTRETTFGTAVAADQKLILGESAEQFVRDVQVMTDARMRTGDEHATVIKERTEHWMFRAPWDFVGANDLGFILAATLGPVSPSTVDTSAVEHLFSASTSRVPASFTMEEFLVSGTQNKYSGCLVTDWTLTMTRDAPASLVANIVAKTKAAGTASSSAIADYPMLGPGLKVYIASAAEGSFDPALGSTDLDTGADITSIVRSVTIGCTQIQNVRRLIGFSNSLNLPVRGVRAFTLSIEFEPGDETYHDYVGDQTTKAIEVEWDSGVLAGAASQNYGWQFVFPKVAFPSMQPSRDEIGYRRQTFPLLVMADATLGPIQAAVWNKQSAFLAAA